MQCRQGLLLVRRTSWSLACMHVQKPLARFLRVCMVLPIFVACFSGRANDGAGVHSAYVTIVRLLGCADLFFLVFVLKTLLAKLMSTHFHKEAHFRKMQEALQKASAFGCFSFENETALHLSIR